MRRVVAHVFVDDLAGPVLADLDLHHLSRVLRLRPGEAVSASDGRGGARLCQWTGSPALEPIGDIVREPRPVPALAVAFALTKGDHPEWAVQKLTEAGMDRVILMTTERCVVRWAPANAGRQLQRLREVARQAAMQSRRVWLPAIEGPVVFSEVAGIAERAGAGGDGEGADVAGTGEGAGAAGTGEGADVAGTGEGAGAAGTGEGANVAGAGAAGTGEGAGTARGAGAARAGPGTRPAMGGLDAAVALAVPGGAPVTLATPLVLIGPEGGWSDAELAAVPHHVGLGPHVLRAETAALAAGVLMAALRAHLVAPARE